MIFRKTKVEEDLEKIRKANLSEDKIYDTKSNSDDLKLEKGDLLAMTLAVMSLIVPYIIAFVGIMAGVVFLMGYFY